MPDIRTVHLKIALLALVPLLMWGLSDMHRRQQADIGSGSQVTIGVEHTKAAAIAITRSVGGARAFVDIGNESDIWIHVHLPSAWVRGEVRNGVLAHVTSELVDDGFTRWGIAPGATISYTADSEWADLTVHNADETPLRVRMTTIDLPRNTKTTDVFLVHDEPLTVGM